MLALYDTIARIAPHFSTALVTGETGTGKELVAAALHRLSPRAAKPFVPVLRVLETGDVTRVGSSDSRHVDVRVIAATNRILDHEVHQGHFRADLFFRLNVIELRVPALRERRSDIPLLVQHFMDGFMRVFGRELVEPDAETMARLAAEPWPGNVRELRNVVERAAMLDTPPLALAAFSRPAGVTTRGSNVRPIAELERAEILRALAETSGNKKEAARRLGLSRRALYRRLGKFGLEGPRVAA